ncbi:MAG: SO2930 family diheme c-type cytochrome, partial [Woeseiaceae bacterium]
MFPADEPPALLSEWAVFATSGDQLALNDGVIPYELKTPLFSDYALKLRTVWMPDGTSTTYDAAQEFEFPVGTIISKTFHYRKGSDWAADNLQVVVSSQAADNPVPPPLSLDEYALIETRLLVRYADGWVGFPYVWNAAQTDAILEIAGDVRQVQLLRRAETQTINYVVPDVNQCAGCHTPDHSAGDLRPLGP